MRKKKPDLLLLDISIPVGSGFIVVESVKTVPEFNGNPFIFITKSHDQELKKLELGAKGFLVKPYELQDVIKIIKEVL